MHSIRKADENVPGMTAPGFDSELEGYAVQARVFAPCPEGCRRLIVATNVAETSITVNGIVYVIDPGRVKQKSYSPQTGMDALSVVPISRWDARAS